MKKITFKIISSFILLIFTINTILPIPVHAQTLNLPAVGQMVMPTPQYFPVIVKGIKIFQDNPFRFDFIMDKGDAGLEGEDFKKESQKLIKYFLSALTTPEEDLWVNLSPYEKDRIIPHSFGQTEMGKDLLAQDYMLKQITASLMYPEDKLGEIFWDKIFEKAYELYGTTDIPINTFNKVWIVPEKAVVYENEDTAFVVESRLKVMLEEDYLAMEKNSIQNNIIVGANGIRPNQTRSNKGQTPFAPTNNNFQTKIIRDVILPAIEKEVNEGKHFTQLRQIYHSLILATWFKINLKKSLLGQMYVDQNKTAGVDVEDKDITNKIYQQYLKAFKQGVYDYIREDFEPSTQEIIPRKYFSGGAQLAISSSVLTTTDQIPEEDSNLVLASGIILPGKTALDAMLNGDTSRGLAQIERSVQANQLQMEQMGASQIQQGLIRLGDTGQSNFETAQKNTLNNPDFTLFQEFRYQINERARQRLKQELADPSTKVLLETTDVLLSSIASGKYDRGVLSRILSHLRKPFNAGFQPSNHHNEWIQELHIYLIAEQTQLSNRIAQAVSLEKPYSPSHQEAIKMIGTILALISTESAHSSEYIIEPYIESSNLKILSILSGWSGNLLMGISLASQGAEGDNKVFQGWLRSYLQFIKDKRNDPDMKYDVLKSLIKNDFDLDILLDQMDKTKNLSLDQISWDAADFKGLIQLMEYLLYPEFYSQMTDYNKRFLIFSIYRASRLNQTDCRI